MRPSIRLSDNRASAFYPAFGIGRHDAARHNRRVRTGNEIRARLAEMNVSEVARRMGMSQPKMHAIKTGERKLTYDEGVRLIPLLWGEEPTASDTLREAVADAERRMLANLQAALPPILALAGIAPDKAGLLAEVAAATIRALQSQPEGDPAPQARAAAQAAWFAMQRPNSPQ